MRKIYNLGMCMVKSSSSRRSDMRSEAIKEYGILALDLSIINFPCRFDQDFDGTRFQKYELPLSF